MSTLKTHNLQSPDAGSVNIALASNAGIVVTGISTFNNDVNFTGANGYNAIWDKSADHLRFEDNAKACFGTSTDLQLWHNGSHSNIKNSTGRLYILADDIWIKDGNDGDMHARFLHDDACELYFDGGKKLETTNTGVTVTGTLSATTFSGSGASLTSLPAANLTGTLPAIDGSNLTGISAGLFAGGATGIHTVSNVGIQTTNITRASLVGAASSMVGMYIGDGSILFNKTLNRTGGYYISTEVNALNAGPVSLGSTLTLDGTWTIV